MIRLPHTLLCVALLATPTLAEWSEPVKLGPNVNHDGWNYFPFVTADSRRLYQTLAPGLRTNDDIYVSEWDDRLNDWGPRHKLGPEVNTLEPERSPCESPDGRYLWFVRLNGEMFFDLYYCMWDSAHGKWGQAQNAGPPLNTPCFEGTVNISRDGTQMFVRHGGGTVPSTCEGPFLHVSRWNDCTRWWDTLQVVSGAVGHAGSIWSASMTFDTSVLWIASSENFPGVPQFSIRSDLYVVRMVDDAWDSIVNLGSPVNTVDCEGTLCVSADGKTLYFSARRGHYSADPDIYVSYWQTPTGIEERPTVPNEHALFESYPNPFNASTSIRYSLPAPTSVSLSIHNILGQRVRVLVNQAMPAGEHEVNWNGRDHSGSDVASGVYFIVMQAGGEQAVRKATVVR